MPSLPPWIGNALTLAPFAYAGGFLITPHPLPYGLAGLAASAITITIGYYILNIQELLITSIYTAALSSIGLAAAMIFRNRALTQAERTGIPANAITPSKTPPGIAVIEGRVHPSNDPDKGLPETRVAVLHTTIGTTTDHSGTYRLEVPDTSFLAKKRVIIEAHHGGYYPARSKHVRIHAQTTTTLDLPLERIVSPHAAASQIRIQFTDEHGNPASPNVKPGDPFGCTITTSAPLTFDQASGKSIPEDQEDLVELLDYDTGKTLLRLEAGSPSLSGTITYLSPTSIQVSGTVPTHYLDGPDHSPKTPLPHTRDIKVLMSAHLNVT